MSYRAGLLATNTKNPRRCCSTFFGSKIRSLSSSPHHDLKQAEIELSSESSESKNLNKILRYVPKDCAGARSNSFSVIRNHRSMQYCYLSKLLNWMRFDVIDRPASILSSIGISGIPLADDQISFDQNGLPWMLVLKLLVGLPISLWTWKCFSFHSAIYS